MEISAKELNELLEKEFERGKRSIQHEKTVNWTQLWVSSPNTDYVPPACKTCSNHPSNGGSGICYCTLCNDVIY